MSDRNCGAILRPHQRGNQAEGATVSNVDKYLAAYLETLNDALHKHPDEYFYGVDQIPSVVDKMIRSAAKGEANISGPMKSAAKRCGIKSTLRAIKDFLSEADDSGTPFNSATPLPPDGEGTHYKIEMITDIQGSRWYVNAWYEHTPYYAMGSSTVRSMPIYGPQLTDAKYEARESLLTTKVQP
jgi:hypothetical protein